MKVVIAGYNSYVGKKFSSFLLNKENEVIAITKEEDNITGIHQNLTIVQYDHLNQSEKTLNADIAFFTASGQKSDHRNYEEIIRDEFFRFFEHVRKFNVKHLICLATILDDSGFLTSITEEAVRNIDNPPATTIIKADFVIGSGSPSFEALRNVVEKLPVMVMPYWVKAPCNPVAIDDLLESLNNIAGNKEYYNKSYTIGNKNTISLGKMVMNYAKTRGMLRILITIPLSVSKISAYLLRILSKTPLNRSSSLIKELKARHKNRKTHQTTEIKTPLNYIESLKFTLGFTTALKLTKTSADTFSTPVITYAFEGYYDTPTFGCSHIKLEKQIDNKEVDKITDRINSIGYKNKWHYINWLWHFKGWTNLLSGTKKEKSRQESLNKGDKLDFWKVQIADKENLHILLFADLFLPGEGWLEFRVLPGKEKPVFRQTLIFRPLGFTGRFYWFCAKLLNYFFLKKSFTKLTKA